MLSATTACRMRCLPQASRLTMSIRIMSLLVSRQSFSYDNIVNAVRLVNKGAKLIGTNSDLTGPTENGIVPGCRALISPIEMATGKKAYFVGKPNPLMMRTGLRLLGVHSEDAVMIGDRMDTDIVAGIESGLDTVLVLSGVTSREDIANYSVQPASGAQRCRRYSGVCGSGINNTSRDRKKSHWANQWDFLLMLPKYFV